MTLQFKPLKLQNTDLFGVSLSGTVGRGDRDRLKELTDKCLKNDKVKVLLDLSQLGTMGGGGARMITELNERLAAADGGAYITGAGETVRRFLDRDVHDKPLNYYASVEEALAQLGGGALAPEEPELEEAPAKQAERPPREVDADGEMDDLLGEFVAESRQGRRKDHHFTSLGEALALLDGPSDRASRMDLSQALKNLLFSQGLAEDVILLVADGGLLISPDGYKEIPLDGALARQARATARPLTMLDIMDENLSEEEISLLEAVDPDLVLPILDEGRLALMVLIKKGGQDREYSVSENFAFELLQQILERSEAASKKPKPVAAEVKIQAPVPAKSVVDDTADEVGSLMLRMALDMPEADDLPHFWRLFSRHLQAEMDVQEMAFLPLGRPHPQVMLGGENALTSLDCSDERLQKFFRGMETPILVTNLPATFAELRKELMANRVNWITSLRWEDKFLGTLLLNGDIPGEDFSEILLETFGLAGRLFLRFEARNDNADEYLELIHRLIAQREKRFFGSAGMTDALVEQLNLLAQEMSFPPDQKRDLIYGCLLRDVGLIDKDDALMGSPADMTPNQWKTYRNHPNEGAALLSGLNLNQTVLEVIRCHHERFNGEGFPAGLSGRDIPLAARVVTVVENYVAMTTGAGGMAPRTPEEASSVLRENLGERYDPDIVGLFLAVVARDDSEG